MILLHAATFLLVALCRPEDDIPRASAKQLRLWKKFYVATGGESWRHCSDAYHDPCSCDSGRRFVRCFRLMDVALRRAVGQSHM